MRYTIGAVSHLLGVLCGVLMLISMFTGYIPHLVGVLLAFAAVGLSLLGAALTAVASRTSVVIVTICDMRSSSIRCVG